MLFTPTPTAASGTAPVPKDLGCAGSYRSDIDGDGQTDPVVGVPDRTPTGGIVVYGTRAGDAPRFLPGSAFAGLDASPSFGTTVARVDANDDGCDDLLVADPDRPGGAAVDVLWGSPQGIQTVGATQVVERHGRHDGFGTSLAVNIIGCYPEPCQSTAELWVGAPGRGVDGVPAAGAVDLFEFDTHGAAHYTGTATANDADPYFHATPGGRFGSVLASERTQSVLVGLPNATVNGKAQAGAVLGMTRYGNAFHAVFLVSQNSPGFDGGAEPGDHFGATIATGGSYQDTQYAVGVPDEDVGTVRDAGLVDLFDLDFGYAHFDGGFTQNSSGVPGVAEPGDHFGAAVAIGLPGYFDACYPTAPKYRVLAVGAPGEDNGGHADSGTVAVVVFRRSLNRDGSCGAFRSTSAALTQGPGTLLGGANEAGDRLGASVDVTFGGDPRHTPPLVVLGVPGEDLGSAADAGVAYAFNTQTNVARAVGNLGGRRAGLQFGGVLAKEVGP